MNYEQLHIVNPRNGRFPFTHPAFHVEETPAPTHEQERISWQTPLWPYLWTDLSPKEDYINTKTHKQKRTWSANVKRKRYKIENGNITGSNNLQYYLAAV